MLHDKIIILCVDDEEIPLILMLRRMVLEKAGYDVVTAKSAKEAIDIITSRDVDLVLSDYLMPGSSGTDLLRQIKERNPGLPVILFSGVNEVPPDAGCADLFLSKVVGPVDLCEKIAMVLSEVQSRKQHHGLQPRFVKS